MAWVLLLVAGVLEVVWAVGLKYTQGFTKPVTLAVVLVALAGSMGLLGLAVRQLPISTAYAVWVGIGVVGTTIYGAAVLGEAISPWRVVFLVLLVVSILGLKVSTPVGKGVVGQSAVGP